MNRATPGPTITLLAVALALLAGPSPAVAQGSELDAVRLLLLAHHDAPSPAALARAAGDPVSALEALAVSADENTLVRRRAISLLSDYADARVEPLLVSLLAAPQSSLRRAAARGLSRRLGARDPERLVPLLATLLTSSEPDDRETAVLLLGQTRSAEARRVLERHRIVERHRAVVAALRQVLAPAPRPGQR